MKNEKNPFEFDRTAFSGYTFKAADNYQRDYKDYKVKERLEIALYLTSIAYRFDMSNPPKMDKTVFSKRTL